jgi:hypothetical protein
MTAGIVDADATSRACASERLLSEKLTFTRIPK